MRQRAVVVETEGVKAKILVKRTSMCEGCHKNKDSDCSGHCEITTLFGSNDKMTAYAENKIGAGVGDTVEIDTESRTVLSYAALVFVFPIVLATVMYLLFDGIFHIDTVSAAGAAAGFILAFVLCVAFDRHKRAGECDIKIVGIVSRADASLSGDKVEKI